uniref:Uncharacterized protein n=1 Tax=Panagrolaimus davidi TaxID=227884 RepID=A0A914QWU7_9BILA
MSATVHETTTSATHDPVRLRFENPDHHSKTTTTTITAVPNPTNPRRTSIIIEERPRTNLTTTFEDSNDIFHHLLLPTLSEFFGTLIYVLFTNLFGISGNSLVAKLGISIMDGAVLAALITALSPFGGLHFNPGKKREGN